MATTQDKIQQGVCQPAFDPPCVSKAQQNLVRNTKIGSVKRIFPRVGEKNFLLFIDLFVNF